MSIEEKAKAYDEALERARNFSLDSSNEEREKFIITSIFPKLTESEDEKTRKSLVKMISDISGDWQFEKYGIIKKDVIAWLEKQKEYISNIDAICLSAEIQKPYKDGNQWCILKGDNIQEGIAGFGNTQEDALVDFIRNVPIEKQKSAEWSEEDEYVINEILHRVKTIDPTSILFEKVPKKQFIASLKSIRPQPHWKPSEEQMEVLKNCAYGALRNGDGPVLRELYNDIKKLT